MGNVENVHGIFTDMNEIYAKKLKENFLCDTLFAICEIKQD